MRREYDIFEKFPDGSTLWRASITGRYETNRKIDELAERSENRFFAIDVRAAETFQPKLAQARGNVRPLVKSAAAG